jgi:hypothetical protein
MAMDSRVILDAWREVLAEVLHTRDTEWKQQRGRLGPRAWRRLPNCGPPPPEFRDTMEAMIAEHLAQIRRPVDGKEGPRSEQGPFGEAGPPGKIASVQAYVEDAIRYRGVVVANSPKSQKPLRIGALS